ncbi:hypothetical protein AN478_06995 [Thiohalorhabdus denitrificans]|uniref:DUF29 domain-containing protein n=1 Tax=Thiohalorhabdus denitrificans TaxID=381306 RepID=A0A0P9C521_9GAMM|nr:DUF29 family protein [Thiohalorhabdus denitrificans]KPV39937.1 hypothetical protein AN478_06995 [Thiohalorhabdus denitrificans]SCY09084.1 protein of unknown function DUF29 [Thiohalorhabdus denitrificans]
MADEDYEKLPPEELYEVDYVRWVREQAQLIQEHGAAIPGVDPETLADEILDLARSQVSQAEDSAEQLIAALIAGPAGRQQGLPRGLLEYWLQLRLDGRWWLKRMLENSPSIRDELEQKMDEINEAGRNQANLLWYRAGLEPPEMAKPQFTLEDLLEDPETSPHWRA